MANHLVNIGVADLKGALAEIVGSPIIGATLVDIGTIAFSDIDVSDVHSVTVTGFNSGSSNVAVPAGSFQTVLTSDTTNGTGGLVSWTYSIDAETIEYLATGQKRIEAFTIVIDDGQGSAVTKTIVVTITGTNDGPVIGAADSAATVTENVGKPPAGLHLNASGGIAFSDVDVNDTHNVSVTKIGTTLGTVTATVSTDTVNGTGGVVTWAYDVVATKLEFLAAGEERIETFDVKVKDTHGGSATQTISITLVGTNDTVVLANVDLKGAVVETAGTPLVGATLSNGGTVAFSDADVADLHTVSVAGFNAGASNVGSALGVLTASLAADTTGGTGGSVAWSYSVDAAAVEYLAVGEKRIEAFDIVVDDGLGGSALKTVVVTVTGTNDAPTVTVLDAAGDVTEFVGKPAAGAELSDSGSLSFADIDVADTHTVSVAKVGTALGSVVASVQADTVGGTGGAVDWTYEVTASKLEYLAAGEQKVENFNVTVKDGHGGNTAQLVTVTLTGTNDAVTTGSADLVGNVTETTGAPAPGAMLSNSGAIRFADVDKLDTHAVTVSGFNTGASNVASALGTLTVSLVSDTINGAGGELTWTYTVNASAVEYLAANQSRIEAFDVVIDDGHGGAITRTVVVTVKGTADSTNVIVGDDNDNVLIGTPGVDTIQALGGNDILQGLASNDTLDGGDGDDAFTGGGGDDFLTDASGRDNAYYTDATGGITVDLAAGIVSGAGVGTDTLRGIEGVIGSVHNDVFVATGFSSTSTNNATEDAVPVAASINVFEGGAGDDTITGNGQTVASYIFATSAIVADLAAGTVDGDASVGHDTLTGVNQIRGSDYGDTISGSNATTIAEFFNGGAGDDLIDGRGGFDRVVAESLTFNTVTGGVIVDMAAGTLDGDASVGHDTLRSIEGVRATSFADTYNATGFGLAGALNVGSNGTFNSFEGRGGDDVITGNGNTQLLFVLAESGVVVDIAAGTADGDASVGHDTFTGVNAVFGSAFADTILGGNGSDSLAGNAGDDLIDGRGGFDTADYSSNIATVSGVTVNMAAGTVVGDASVGTDTLRSIEQVRGSQFADVYDATGFGQAGALNIGNSGTFNAFQGNAGDDVITGNGNTQVLFFSTTGGVSITLGLNGSGGATGDASNGADTFLSGVNNVVGTNFADSYDATAFVGLNNVTGGAGNDTIVGNGSTQINFGSATAGITVDLAAGTVVGNASVGTDTVFGIGTVSGTSFNDTLSGSIANEVLAGNVGSDRLDGRGGNDNLIGGTQNDTFVFGTGGGSDNVNDFSQAQGDKVDLSGFATGANGIYTFADVAALASQSGAHTVIDFGSGDVLTLANVTFASLTANDFIFGTPAPIVGDNNDNTLIGTSGNDTIQGLGGNDMLQGRAGDDALDGGLGIDRASYAEATGAITVNLAAGTVSGAGVGSDTLTGVEGVIGSAFNDSYDASGFSPTVIPAPGALRAYNEFEGGAGNDTIIGNVNGVNGGFGTAASYAHATGAVSVNLATGATGDASVGTDTFTNVGSVIGSDFSDTLVGSSLAIIEQFEGRGGADFIDGQGSIDIVSYINESQAINVNLAAGTVTGGDGNDTLRSVERVFGTQFADTFNATGFSPTSVNAGSTGTSNLFQGMGGNDIITGNGATMVSYTRALAAVTVDLQLGSGQGTAAGDVAGVGVDSFTGVNGIQGSDFNDTLLGGAAGDTFDGRAGDDFIDGRGSFDSIAYNGTPNLVTGITVDMASGVVTGDIYNGTDTLRSIEQVTGTGGADTYVATGFGQAGALNIGSSGTFNAFQGGGGSDIITGNGNTQVVYALATAGVAIVLGANGSGAAVGDASVGNDTFVSGINNVIGSNFADSYDATAFVGLNTVSGGSGNDTIIGNGSTQINFGNATAGVTVDLAAGTAVGNASVGTDTVSGIGTVSGTSFSDTLSGSAANEALAGNIGSDRLDGRGGNDILIGGTQNDTFVFGFGGASDNVNDFNQGQADKIDLTGFATGPNGIYTLADVAALATQSGAHTVINFGGGDVLTLNAVTFSNLTANDFIFGAPAPIVGDANDNVLVGTTANDTIDGLGGNDTLQGRAGNDALDGGAGIDRASYADATGSVTVNLAAGTVSGAGIGSDTLTDVEGVIGSDFADTYDAAGFAGAAIPVPGVFRFYNEFEGGAGNDTITGNTNGINGGSGTAVSYAHATGAVTVNLGTGATGNASVGTDTFVANVATVIGSNFADSLVGTSTTLIEQFEGRGGADFINGSGSIDIAVYINESQAISVNLAAGTVTGGDGNDTLRSIERVFGTQFADTFVATGFSPGSTNAGSTGTSNLFQGMGGNDLITGNGATTVSYNRALDGVTVDLQAGTGHGTAAGDVAGVGNDTFTGANGIQGSDFNDTLLGAATGDTIDGRGGDDFIDGRSGFDQVVYNTNPNTAAGITVDMASGVVTGDIYNGTDTLRSIEQVVGTSAADTYVATGFGQAGALNIGNSGALNTFQGNGGNDTITGNGNTHLLFINATAGVAVDLLAGTASGDTSVGNDTFTGVSIVTGSNFNDTIAGNAGNNSLQGGTGADVIEGRGGVDVLTGGVGNDTFVFRAGFGQDTVTDFVNADFFDFHDGIFDDYNDLLAASQQVGSNVLITADASNTITVQNTTLSSWTSDSFHFLP